LLEVRLVESGPEETPRWAWMTEPEPAAPRAQGVFRGGRVAMLELVVEPPPETRASDRASRGGGGPDVGPDDPRRPIAAEMLPRPTILVGTGLSPWPGPATAGSVVPGLPVSTVRAFHLLPVLRSMGPGPPPPGGAASPPRLQSRTPGQTPGSASWSARLARRNVEPAGWPAEAERRCRRGHRRAGPSL